MGLIYYSCKRPWLHAEENGFPKFKSDSPPQQIMLSV